MRRVLFVVGIVVVLTAILSWLPFVATTRPDIIATPGPMPVSGSEAVIPLKAGARICVDRVAIDPELRTVHLQLTGTRKKDGPPLTVTVIDGAGRTVTSGVARGYPIPGEAIAPLHGPPSSIIAFVCVRSATAPIELLGAKGIRTTTRSTTTIDSVVTNGQMVLELRGADSSLLTRLGEVFRHAATFKPVRGWEIAVLALLVLLALPGGLALALRGALASDREGPR